MQADLRICWSHIPHCWKSHVTSQLYSAKSDVRLYDYFGYACFAPDLVWRDVGDLDSNYLQTLKTGERERERERACIQISCNLEKYHVSVLKIILGDASRAHRLLHDKVGYSTVLILCMLSFACPNVSIDETFFPEFHSDLIWIRTLTTFFFFFSKGERIQISLKAGHHWPASETPLHGKKSDRRDVLERLYYIINDICADGEQAKAFWYSEGRTKV